MRTVQKTVAGLVMGACATVLAVGAATAPQAAAYEEATVANGATLTGQVSFSGTVPPPTRFELRRYYDRAYCGTISDGTGYRLLQEVVVGSTHGLKDVIVTVEDVPQGKPFTLNETTMEASMCQFVPFVAAMRNEHPLHVVNLDSVAHDLQIYEREREHIFIMFHRPALTKEGTSDNIRFSGKRRGVTMQCGMHPYMQAHGVAVENPYYAVTSLDGSFSITDLPAGTYRVRAWHPILGEKEQTITVAEGGQTQATFAFEGR
ncbi:MAG: hypothetical protein U0172_12015 [Nitrospiraceae bacterium]